MCIRDRTIIKNLPHICNDPQKLWELICIYYGPEVFTPMFAEKYAHLLGSGMEER